MLLRAQNLTKPDPFDPWYASQLTVEGAGKFNADSWEFFTINHDADSRLDVQEKAISVERVNDWALQLVSSTIFSSYQQLTNKDLAIIAVAWN